MCGFVASLGPDRGDAGRVVRAMADQLVHRGPDGSGYWSAKAGASQVEFAHRRLSILDLDEGANQPFLAEDRNLSLVFNGEIYNFVELRKQLEGRGSFFRTTGDTEVILKAYQAWGVGMLPRLNGMFALILWDKRRQSVLVARDRFGEKPLFTAPRRDGGAVFASEQKALFLDPEIECSPNPQVVNAAILGQVIPANTDTFFKNVKSFPAASAGWFGADGACERVWRYWTPEWGDKHCGSYEDLCAEFKEKLIKSVRMRTRSDVDGTACLSGGMDSSTLVALLTEADEERGFRLSRTISARFDDDEEISEGEYIDAVLDEFSDLKRQALFVSPTASDLSSQIGELHYHQEAPLHSSSAILEWEVMKAAKNQGFRVIIDGQGADEILAGYSSYLRYYLYDLLAQGRDEAARDLWRTIAARHEALRPRFADPDRRLDYLDETDFNDLLEWREQEYVPMTAAYADRPGIVPAVYGESLPSFFSAQLVRDSLPLQLQIGDRNSMAHSVEARYPFLDHDLVDWCLKLPIEALIRDGWQKSILRDIPGNRLPPKVVRRVDKLGYQPPEDKWMSEPPMARWIEERIFSDELAAFPGYDLAKVSRLWQLSATEGENRASELWYLASTAEFLSMFKNNRWCNLNISSAKG